MQHTNETQLQSIVAALDASVLEVIANPQLGGVEPLRQAADLCLHFQNARLASDYWGDASKQDCQTLWEIRSRVGRLKMLLDSAGVFYRSLSFSDGAEPFVLAGSRSGMDYDVQGEWKETSNSGLLSIDC